MSLAYEIRSLSTEMLTFSTPPYHQRSRWKSQLDQIAVRVEQLERSARK